MATVAFPWVLTIFEKNARISTHFFGEIAKFVNGAIFIDQALCKFLVK